MPPLSAVGISGLQAGEDVKMFVNVVPSRRFGHPEGTGEHAVHDSAAKRDPHGNFFPPACVLKVRTPHVKLPDGSVRPLGSIKRSGASTAHTWKAPSPGRRRGSRTAFSKPGTGSSRPPGTGPGVTAGSRPFVP